MMGEARALHKWDSAAARGGHKKNRARKGPAQVWPIERSAITFQREQLAAG
jgi:hypothetical protein